MRKTLAAVFAGNLGKLGLEGEYVCPGDMADGYLAEGWNDMLVQGGPQRGSIGVLPADLIFVEPGLGEVLKRGSIGLYLFDALFVLFELSYSRGVWKVLAVLESAQQDFCFDTLEDVLQALSIRRRIFELSLLTATTRSVPKVYK